MRQAKIFYGSIYCGLLIETDDGDYTFGYDDEYVEKHPSQFITFNLQVRKEPYVEKRLFPFFDGLIPEGWLLNIASKSWKINANDRMGLLMACCQNCIGAVSVEPIIEENE